MQDWWRGSTTYQIYPRSFQDSNGDGIGDINGITQRLQHIADLGVDAIWLSPVFTSPMADMGYDVSDYTGINPEFGTLEDFDAMITRAHQLGLKVIIDQVLSHSSIEHPHFQESRKSIDNEKSDWYVWADPKPDGSPPNNWMSIFGGIAWQWETQRRQYYLHNFLVEQPDWNFHNPKVQDFHLDNMRFWLDRGVDGFRLDTVNFYFHDELLRDNPSDYRKKTEEEWNPYEMQYHLFDKNQPENVVFVERMRALLDEYENRAMVGEMGESHHPIKMMGEYTSGKRLQMCYSFELMGVEFSAAHFRSRVENFFNGAPKGWPCWAFSNHDVMRHVSRWQEYSSNATSLAKQSAALLLSLEGSVCLYQGEELGQTESDLEFHELTDPQGINFWPETKGRDGCRTPMVWNTDEKSAGFTNGKPWLPIKDKQLLNAADGQKSNPNSVLEFYRTLLSIRKNNGALKLGRTTFIDTEEPILAFIRDDQVLCVFNLSAEPKKIDIVGELTPIISEGVDVTKAELSLASNGFGWFDINEAFRLL